jgi:signal transduction histidine kinase/DNA-binding response OmpR family regulator
MSGNVQILKKLYFGFGTIISILLVLIFLAIFSFQKLSEANVARARSYQILAETQSLRQGLSNMDMAARGFVITGDVEFLPALFQGQKDFLFNWEQVKKQTRDNSEQQKRLADLRQKYDKWVTAYFEPLRENWLSQSNKRVPPEDVVRISKQGKPYTEAMYSIVTDINKASLGRLTERTLVANQLQTLTQLVQIVGGGFGVLLSIGLSILLTRNTKQLSKINRDLKNEIAERHQVESALHQAKEAAESADRAKSEFLANMSHELRTPLNAIIGFSEILQDKTFGDLNLRQEKYVSNVLSSGRHLLQLINDILDLSKIEAGRMELELSTVNIRSAINDVETIIRSLAFRKHIELNVEVEPNLPNIEADESKLKQILYNLLSNAIKFTPDVGCIRLIAQQMKTSDNEHAIRITVSDTGIGIKPEDLKRVFSEFEQIDSSYGRLQEGTGLGLSLSRRFVEMHGGRIWVESDGDERGSNFIFEIPIDPSKNKVVPQVVPEIIASIYPENDDTRPVVLVVENDSQARELFAYYLSEAGYAVAHAVSGEQALQIVKEITLHAIVLDILLPKKDGWDVLTELKSQPETRDIPVVIVSITENRDLGFSLGAIEYFVKPVDRDRLIDVIRHARDQIGREKLTILVIDDEPLNVEALNATLRGIGCNVLSAYGGQQGIDIAIKRLPDVVILDLIMPNVTGFDVVRQLREHPKARDIPILILTAKDITEEDRQQLNHHVKAIVPKSVRENLVSEIAKLKLF